MIYKESPSQVYNLAKYSPLLLHQPVVMFSRPVEFVDLGYWNVRMFSSIDLFDVKSLLCTDGFCLKNARLCV